MPLNYQPDFAHRDWIDQLDRVRASGEDGFNARFHAISAEFRTIARHLQEIGKALDELGQPPAVQPVTLTLTPVVFGNTKNPWEQGDGVINSPKNADRTGGFMPVALPHGVRLVSLTAFGTATGDSLAVAELQRQPLAGAPNGERIALVQGTGGAFTRRDDIDPGALATVDVTQFKYRVSARWNWRVDVDQTAQFSVFQIVYVPN